MNTTDKINLENFILMRDNVRKIRKNYEQIVKEQGKEVFLEAAKQIFQTNPNLEHFSWNQYTPYFNDGDECTFRVNRHYLTLNRTDESLDRYEVDYWKDSEYEYTPDPKDYNCDSIDELISIVEGIGKVLDLFEDDDLSLMFGDHAEITVFRDGRIDIDSYDHD